VRPETESSRLRVEKERRRSSSKQRRSQSKRGEEVDEREARVVSARTHSSRSRRDRIYPEGVAPSKPSMSSKVESESGRKSRRRSKGRSSLRVDTQKLNDSTGDHQYDDSTPRTQASTPSSPSNSVGGNSDLRSPGVPRSPKIVADEEAPLPDFITQTDQYGNATTPRSDTAIKQARVEHPTGAMPHLHVDENGKLTEDPANVDDVDACTETLLDSIRIMCCCLMPDEESSTKNTKVKEEKKAEKQIIKRPSLLPDLHPDDTGKKCLVLDLDETLVHSSFRAVPGADFVIPVQVCNFRIPFRPSFICLVVLFAHS